MKTSRLKSIVIVILALTNAFLLILLLNRRAQERGARERRMQQLEELYTASGVSLSADVPEEARLGAVEPVRDLAAEAAFAEALLGQCSCEDMGGGIYRYSGESGWCLLRSGGVVEAFPNREVQDPERFADRLANRCGYRLISAEPGAEGVDIRAIRRVSDSAVFNAALLFSFRNGRLTSVSGAFLPEVEPAESPDSLDAVTALVRFLDYSKAGGEICTAIDDVESGYLLQSTASASLRLIPAWRITTDVNRYYVNMINGEVTRETA